MSLSNLPQHGLGKMIQPCSSSLDLLESSALASQRAATRCVSLQAACFDASQAWRILGSPHGEARRHAYRLD